MVTHASLCIGGPLDGQLHDGGTNVRFRIQVQGEGEQTYRWHVHPLSQAGFWLHESIWSHDLMMALWCTASAKTLERLAMDYIAAKQRSTA